MLLVIAPDQDQPPPAVQGCLFDHIKPLLVLCAEYAGAGRTAIDVAAPNKSAGNDRRRNEHDE